MKSCCIIGHRDFEKSEFLELKVKETIINLIEKERVTNFLFGSNSKFNDFCYDIVSELKNIYVDIKRIFVRAEFPVISNDYFNYLKKFYEDSYFYSEKLITNKFSHIRRNQIMINRSDFCLFYFNNNYIPKTKTQSGTKLAYEYATKKGKSVINIF